MNSSLLNQIRQAKIAKEEALQSTNISEDHLEQLHRTLGSLFPQSKKRKRSDTPSLSRPLNKRRKVVNSPMPEQIK